MKRIIVIPGVIILLIAAYLAYDATSLSQVSNQLGFSANQNIVDKTVLVSINPGNFSYLSVPLSPQDSMSAALKSNPPGSDVLLMNQGNFSQYVANNGSFVAIYPASVVNVSIYTLVFDHVNSSGNYYLVFRNPQSTQATDVLVHLTVSSLTTASNADYIPIIIAVAGLILVAIGVFSGKITKYEEKPHPSPSTLQVDNATKACRYCKATMNNDAVFCPSCKKSQS